MDICRFSGYPVFAPGTSNLLIGAAVYVYNSGTTTPASVTSDPAGSTPHTYPIIVGSDGLIPAIYWGEGTFRVRVNVSESDITPVWDFDGIKGEVVVMGGGGGVTPPDEQLFTTGDVKLRFEDGAITGFVRANNRSIGSASSGATERAAADCEALYLYGWNKWSDTYAPVAGGRGANAASDWAANKPMTLLNALGKALVGLDTMGNSAANVSQRSTTITTTNASTSAAVTSATGIARGMYVVSTSVPEGTTVTAVSGTTITLSNAATVTNSGVPVRFSMLRDAEAPGATGGGAYQNLNASENGPHTHDGPDHTHLSTYKYKGATLSGTSVDTVMLSPGSGTGTNFQINSGNQSATTTTSSGSGNAVTNMQPSIGVTIYIKL